MLLITHAAPRRFVGSTLRIAAIVLLVAQPARSDDGHVVPVGQEDLVAEMLGRGQPMGGCRLIQVDMQPAALHASYQCEGVDGVVAVALEYPAPDRAAVFKTLKFAATTEGEVPGGLLDALRRRITEHEAGWQWSAASDVRPRPADDAQAATGSAWFWLPPAASCAAMLVVLVVGLLRRQKEASP